MSLLPDGKSYLHRFTADKKVGLEGADFAFLTYPSKDGVAVADELLAAGLSHKAQLVSMVKGLVPRAGGDPVRYRRYLKERFPQNAVSFLGGASFAEDMIRFDPIYLVATGDSVRAALEVANLFNRSHSSLSVHVQRDALTVELSTALKNVVAIGCGFCNRYYGRTDETGRLVPPSSTINSLAAVGYAEISMLTTLAGARIGARLEPGVLADHFMTCTDPKSRNFQLGEFLADYLIREKRRPSSEEMDRAPKGVAEGRTTIARLYPVLERLQSRLGSLRFPVLRTIYDFIHGTGAVQVDEIANRLLRADRYPFNDVKRHRGTLAIDL
jgi:glycerol-3-phosphate dehydrogenase (NAD(P)+)